MDIHKKKSPFLKSYYAIMPTCSIDMQRMGEFRLPNLFMVSGYKVYFWSNENNELRDLMEFISAQYFLICSAWKEHFATDSIKYYC